jgi:hypothetical protein
VAHAGDSVGQERPRSAAAGRDLRETAVAPELLELDPRVGPLRGILPHRIEAPAMRRFAAVLLLFPLGCGEGSPPSPAQPTTPVAVAIPEFRLSGSVSDSASRTLGGARIEVVSGPNAGLVATTDQAGRFVLPGTFTSVITVTASADGYVPETRSMPPVFPPGRPLPTPAPGEVIRWDMGFQLAPVGPSANLAGLYTLTLTADRTCEHLPDRARTRTYTATITPGSRSTSFLGKVGDGQFLSTLPCGNRPAEDCAHNQFSIGVAGDFASVSFGIVEALGESGYVAIEGWLAASVLPSGITAPVNSNFLYCSSPPEWTSGEYWACPSNGAADAAECYSQNHQFSLVRR